MEDNGWNFDLENEAVSLEIVSSRLTGTRVATVTVQRSQFFSGGVFGSSASTDTFEVWLQRVGETWTITEADAYWVWCWNQIEGC